MDSLFLQIVPGYHTELSSTLEFYCGIFAAGVLLSLLIWVLGFTVREVFRLLGSISREEGK